MDIDSKIKAYRFVGYAALTFSTIAVLSVCITLPMMYNYIHHTRKTMHHEIVECRAEAKKLWGDVNRIPDMVMAHNRTARQHAVADHDKALKEKLTAGSSWKTNVSDGGWNKNGMAANDS
uniref:Col_cuticle_N domain-containing protein n=2 Tax=Caenorhabditis japonica TaxID=281687 RepID=A0A8R1IHC0_CAEJA